MSQSRRRDRAVAVGAVLAVAAALGGCAVAPNRPPGRYVALGDSYAAGILTGDVSGQPRGCLRSVRDYPQLLDQDLHPAQFVDVTCSAATAADLTAAQQVAGRTAGPQVDALTGATTLVTVTIGGNDIGFGSILARCTSVASTGAPCRDYYTAAGVDRLAARVSGAAGKVRAGLAAIRAHAPRARVFLVGYPTLLPRTGGCWPRVPFTAADAAYLHGVEGALNAMLAVEARAAGVRFVDTAAASAGHDMCAGPRMRWVEPLIPASPAAPFHPNALGERAMAEAARAALGAPAR